MARTNNLTNFLTDVAGAIKEKKGSETDIPAANFDTEIRNLPSQGTYQEKSVTIYANGTQTIEPDTGYDAISELEVTTQVPDKQLQIKNYEFTTNANVELEPDTGYDGFSKVGLSINVPDSGGTDTSDATATVSDIINPKTAYVKGQKVTGGINPDYSTEGEITVSDKTISSSLQLQYQVMDISVASKVCVKYDGSKLYVYKIVDDIVQSDSPTQYTNTELSITSSVGFGRPKFAPQVNTDGTINLVIVVAAHRASGSPFYIHLYKLNPDTLSIEHLAVNSTAMTEGNQYHNVNSTAKTIDIAFSSSDKFLVGTVYAAEGSTAWDNVTGYFRYAYMQIVEESNLARISSNTLSIGSAGFGLGWTESYPRLKIFYQDGYFQIYEEKNYRVTERSGVDTYTYWSMFLKETDFSFFYKTQTESTSSIFVECNGYIIGNGQIFSVNSTSTAIGTTEFSPKFSSYVGIMGKNIIQVDNGYCKIFTVNDDGTVVKKNQYAASYGQYDSNNLDFLIQINNEIKLFDIQKNIIALTRNGIKYKVNNEATVTASNILSGKKAYDNNSLITGTMTNNGTRYVTPSASTQTLPSGYYSILRVYGDSDLVSGNIKNGVNIFGVTGTYAGIDTSDANAVATDIKIGQTAYVNGTKITGTLPEVINPASISSTEIYNGSFFKPDDGVGTGNLYGNYLVTDNQGLHIGTQYLVNWVKVTDLQTWYIQNQQKVKVGIPVSDIATTVRLTSNILRAGYTVLGVVGTYSPSGSQYSVPDGMKFSRSTFTNVPMDMDFSSVTNMQSMFANCVNLVTVGAIDTSSATTMQAMFQSCTNLTTVPQFNASSVNATQGLYGMFSSCNKLTDTSVNNILAMCISATNYTGTKTLYQLGLRSTYYPASTIQGLSNYSAFTAAGWTIGY